MSQRKYLYRKDIANMTETNSDVVRKNEHAWGIDKYRADLNSRHIRYKSDETTRQLRARGIIE